MDGGAALPTTLPTGHPSLAVRRPIRVLPTLVANQIAAGEVVERPASVVKELVENSIDAGATRVRVEIEQGGIELVRITDDGGGIPADELPLALAPHATSKVRSAEDLEGIATKGFRGEALASIASVSRLSIRSRTHASEAAAEIACEGDSVQPVRPASGAIGTVITCRNLFFNTPARRKFLKTPATEQGRCLDAVREIALAHPAVGFNAHADGRQVFELPTGQSPRERVLAVLGEELAEQMLEVTADSAQRGEAHAGALSLWGMIGLPTLARATASAQHVALNGRTIRDKTIQHAIKEAYRGLIEPGRHPTAVLLLEIDPRLVDVNVHPAKTEVRFRDTSLVHSLVYRTIQQALQSSDLTVGYAPRPVGQPGRSGGAAPAGGSVPGVAAQGSPARFSAGLAPSSPVQTNTAHANAFADAFKARFTAQGEVAARFPFEQGTGTSFQTEAGELSQPQPVRNEPGLIDITPTTRPLQVHNSYLVTQDAFGMVVIDQHALHERVMFEKLLDRVAGTAERVGVPLESQRLLMPAMVPADARRVEALESCRGLFNRIGLTAEQIGPSQIAVHAFPTFLFDRNVEVEPFIAEVLDRAAAEGERGFSGGPSSEQALHEVLDMMACKAAIKAGNALSDLEIAELLAYRERIERSSSCPHGRPTSVRLTIKDLERLFHRS